MWDTRRDSRMFAWPYDSPRRGAATPERQFGEFDAGLGGWTLDGEPYTTAGRRTLRLVPHAHARRPHQSLGPHLAALRSRRLPAPEPRRARRRLADHLRRSRSRTTIGSITLVGIFGSSEGLPNEPDGIFQPPPRPRCYELLIKQAADRLKITCIASRLSILTQPLNGRPACHYCGQCGRGCASHANFSSPSVLLPPALATKTPDDHHQRDGARGDGRRRRAGQRRRLHRQDHRPRESRARAHRRARGERVRVGAAAAQFEVVEVPAGAGEFERHRRPLPHGLDRHQRARVHPAR